MGGLRFRPDGTFTIVQLTDLHWQNGDELDQLTASLMAAVLDAEQPDLVLLTGDVIYSKGCREPREAYRQAVAPITARGIPWAAVFGNHDAEAGITRGALLRVMQSLPGCLTTAGPVMLSGVGNYVLPVYSARQGSPAATLYCLDSGSYAPAHIGGYDWIRRDQIDWYVRTATARRLASGTWLPALAFFHIPLPEYETIWATRTCHGERWEEVCCPKVNSGFFAALVEMGEVLGTFVGHDHVNDYWGELHGIRLCYGRATGYNTYGREGFPRGARLIRLYEGERRFDTWLRLEGGAVVTQQPVHAPGG